MDPPIWPVRTFYRDLEMRVSQFHLSFYIRIFVILRVIILNVKFILLIKKIFHLWIKGDIYPVQPVYHLI